MKSDTASAIRIKRVVGAFLLLGLVCTGDTYAQTITLKLHDRVEGQPVTTGVPLPKGALHSPDDIRLALPSGVSIPAQVTEVTTWEPMDPSIKWIWVHFKAPADSLVVLHIGESNPAVSSDFLSFVNNQRPYGETSITTGPLRVDIDKANGAGFIDALYFDVDGDGITQDDLIAQSTPGRGSYLDYLHPNGVDRSQAVVDQTFRERGSGPMHAILRIEGRYTYPGTNRPDSPFVTRIHAYAGSSQLRVLHSITYTGTPDQHEPPVGAYSLIATASDSVLIDESKLALDEGWTQPLDRINAAGLSLSLIRPPTKSMVGVREGAWWDPSAPMVTRSQEGGVAVVQSGPAVDRQTAPTTSSMDARMEGFPLIFQGETVPDARWDGWVDVQSDRIGLTVAYVNALEAYPSGIKVSEDGQMMLEIWPASSPAASFNRYDTEPDAQMLGNFATGFMHTTELVLSVRSIAPLGGERTPPVEVVAHSLLSPTVASIDPQWVADTDVFGAMAPLRDVNEPLERGYFERLDWWLFNQAWEPWYGKFEYGDGKTYFFRDDWYMWSNNEPAQDYMFWIAFLRSGNPTYFHAAKAASRHTMDVDNIHWPKARPYLGDTNPSADFFRSVQQPPGSPYIGIGRRHAMQQFNALLSAHVWTAGWMTAYLVGADHRGLDVAKQTADTYLKRIWGEHDLRGRRLYLSIWNLAEVFDVTKDDALLDELNARVDLALELQREQGGNLVLDRYGYAQSYVVEGLEHVYQLTGRPDIPRALVTHGRFVRDNPPLNHQMESYLASIRPLVSAYSFSGDTRFLAVAQDRASVLHVDRPTSFSAGGRSQRLYHDALIETSRLPGEDEGGRPPIWSARHGLRIYGWTHAFTIPYLQGAIEASRR